MSTWLEAAINGPWGRERQPGVPLSVEECIETGIACVEAGAAIVHVHAFDPETDEQTDDPDVYARIIEGIQERVDAIVYPTIPLATAADIGETDGTERFAHQADLGERGLLEWAVVDPGSVNVSAYPDIERDDPGFVYTNPESHVRTGLEIAARDWRSTPDTAPRRRMPSTNRDSWCWGRRWPNGIPTSDSRSTGSCSPTGTPSATRPSPTRWTAISDCSTTTRQTRPGWSPGSASTSCR